MKHSISIFILLITSISYSQDVNFNQVNLTGLYSNPALTGANGEQKISTSFQSQSPSLSSGIRSTFASYEDGSHNFGNFGGYYLNSYYSNGAFNSNRFGLNYAKPIRLTRKLMVTAGLNASLILDHINFNKVTFGDLANPRTGRLYDPLALKENTFSGDFSGGILVNWQNVFFGASFNQWGSLGAKSIFNTYANIGISLRGKGGDFAIIPEISYNTLSGFHSAAIKVSSYYKWAKLGVEYSARDAFSAVVGASIGNFDLSLSGEWTISKLTNSVGGSYEVGLSYKLKNNKKNQTFESYDYSLF